MDFLDSVYFNNSVRSFLAVGGIILLVFLFKKYLSRIFASLLYILVNKIWTNIARKDFYQLVIMPMGWFLVVIISVFSIDKLNFPEELKYIIYGHSVHDIIDRLGVGVIIISFTWLGLRLVDFISFVLEENAIGTSDARDGQLIVFFRDLLKVLVGICGTLLIIKGCFHQPLGNVVTGLSLVGAALAFAGKESLENLIASFIIFFDKPFFTGDLVKVNSVTGTVEKIGLRSTRLRTPDKTLVTVPNKQMVDTMVDNWSMRTNRRAEIKLELEADTSLEKIKKITTAIENLLKENNEEIISYDIVLQDISKYGLLIWVQYFNNPVEFSEFNNIKQKLLFDIKSIIEAEQVSFAKILQ